MAQTQAIPCFVINLNRRADRLARITAHLEDRGVAFRRIAACDARAADAADLDRVVARSGPLGELGLGDRACTVSHSRAWQAVMDGTASHGLVLEDDVYLAKDIARILAHTNWIPPETYAVKLEKFNAGTSRLLLGRKAGETPSRRGLYPMRSRHVGAAAYILSREGAALALSHLGQYRVPVDHILFNNTVSPIHRSLAPSLIVPAMATQRAYDYDSDIAPLGKSIRPSGWRKRLRTLRRGLAEVSQAPRQLAEWVTGRAHIQDVTFAEDAPSSVPSSD